MKKKTFKKITSFILVAMMSVLLVACGGTKEYENNNVVETVDASCSEVVSTVFPETQPEQEEELVAVIEQGEESVVVPTSTVEPVATPEPIVESVVIPESVKEPVTTPEPTEEPIIVASEEHVHNYVVTETVAATCTEMGKEVSACECGDCQVVNIKESEHNFVLIENTEATCTQAGKTVYACSHCGMESISIVRRGHHFTMSIKDATCTANGSKSMVCTVCKHVQSSEVIPMTDHNYTERITAQPTCVANGKKETYCTNCGHVSKTEDIPATGQHNLQYMQIGPCCLQTYCGDGCGYRTCTLTSGSADEMLGYINAQRANVGSPALVLDSGMCSAAQSRANQIVSDYSHNGNNTGYAENINMALSVSDCYSSWAGSSGHYSNMMGYGYTRMGFAWASGPDAVYFVALFD